MEPDRPCRALRLHGWGRQVVGLRHLHHGMRALFRQHPGVRTAAQAAGVANDTDTTPIVMVTFVLPGWRSEGLPPFRAIVRCIGLAERKRCIGLQREGRFLMGYGIGLFVIQH